jgi:hypothetical protein
MCDLQKTYNLIEFWHANLPDGLYAVWVNKLIFDGKEGVLNGLKYSIATYSERSGFSMIWNGLKILTKEK